jgi:hypothetical protein
MATPTTGEHTTRVELHRIATHVLARGQHRSTGRIGLRVSPGGFSSIPFDEDQTRLRVSGTSLVRESSASKSARAISIVGSSLGQLADFAGVDLTTEFRAGEDTPPTGDLDTPIVLDPRAARRIAAWFDLAAQALDEMLRIAPPWSEPSIPQLWPEHFDIATDLAVDPAEPDTRRLNLGGVAGDGSHAAPYLYVGPWTAERPGDPDFWNAPFGAVLGRDEVVASGDHLSAAVEFFRTGLDRLAP